jgi:zinc D-Ala-D-Ala carboxypeptidase
MRISKHISYEEAIRSETAIKFGIDNNPNTEQILNMQELAMQVFEPIRTRFNLPIGISSFYRSLELNKRIGGATASQHNTGEAMDINANIFGGLTNAQIFDFIKNNLEFDQLIWEFGNDDEPAWVHVSYKRNGGNRKQILKAIKENGKTRYVTI